MRAKTKIIDPDAVDPNGIFTVDTVTGTAPIVLTLAGALVSDGVATMDLAHRIAIISSGADSGITFTVVGTDADNRAITEVITGGATATVESVAYFKTITSITASGAAAANVTIGTVDKLVSNTIPLNHYAHDAATVSIEKVTGTIDFSIEETFSDIWDSTAYVFRAASAATLTTITAAAFMNMDNHATGIRFVANSYTTGADVTIKINSNG